MKNKRFLVLGLSWENGLLGFDGSVVSSGDALMISDALKKKNAKMFHVKQIYILSISSIVYFLIYHNGSLLGSPAFLGYFLGVIFSFWII